ncbi:hypothetical protein HK098_000263 [Nowakowskiella sp. JEL0407]|nr:hypothetical protein HK098_000263 [Nowakowskiella sp. JEL0407]
MGTRTLQDFGYAFNGDGQLRNTVTGGPFNFMVRAEDMSYNQAHYEALGAAVTEHIITILKNDLNFVELSLPVDAKPGEVTSKVFASADYFSSEDPLLVLVPGSNIEVGQWARKIVINDNLNSGSMIEYIRKAKSLNWQILILNNNENTKLDQNGKEQYIRGSWTPEDHVLYVWDEFISKSRSKAIAFVAHSFGAHCTMNLFKNRDSNMMERVAGIAFTDAAMMSPKPWLKADQINWIKQHTKNWVRGTTLDEKNESAEEYLVVPSVSAGHIDHSYTTVTAIESVFSFLSKQIILKNK